MRSQRKPQRIYRFRPGRYEPLRRALLILCAVGLVTAVLYIADRRSG